MKKQQQYRLGKSLGLILIWLGLQLGVKQKEVFAQTATLLTAVDESKDTSVCVADIEPAIAEIINRSNLRRSRWGILVQTLDTQETLYALAAERHFIPASNTKLLTTAAVLTQLGTDFRIRTPFYATGTVPNLITLRVVGKGDPSLTTAKLRAVAQQLKQAGVEEIEQLIVQDGYFSESPILASWEWEDVYAYYGVAVNSLILDENAVVLTLLPQQLGQPVKVNWSNSLAARQWQVENTAVTAAEGTPYGVTIDGVLGERRLKIAGELAADAGADIWGLAIRNPAEYFLASLRTALILEGIEVQESAVTTTPETTSWGEAIAVIESPSLEVLIKDTNQPSNNLYAEALLRTLGVEKNSSGIAATEDSLTALGVDSAGYLLKDGSGLSRHNLVSPQAIVQTLSGIAKTPLGEIYRNSLPLAGVNGTLRRRFQNTPLQGQLRAKTGTVTGTSALSGYLESDHFPPLVFSILINQSDQSVSSQREAIDEIVLLLSRLQSCQN
ncbi:MAG: D-alanyl-D-alanine carboxypeptidase/D-alanyl-D-alanine-endopeptidase [Spirulinaceae cyanobacterium]